ncbi:hypothetical protein Amme1_00034 [Pseudomonas phage vB_PpuM-Amme-1]
MKSRVGIPVGETLVFEDRTNANNLGQLYKITVKNVTFHHIQGELARTVELCMEIVDGKGVVARQQTFFTQQNSPFPFGKLSLTVGMVSKSRVSKSMVILACIHPHWMKVYPENQSFPLTTRDVINHEPELKAHACV